MVYRTFQGREIDMEKLARANELTPAVGNAGVNARGDKLGPGGKIIQKREDIVAEYYEANPKATKMAAPKVQPTVTESPAPASAKTKKPQVEE